MVVVTNLMRLLASDAERSAAPRAFSPAPADAASSASLSDLADPGDLGVGVLFDRLLDAIVIARLSTGRIVLWNRAAEKLFGFTADEVIGKSIEILMPSPIAAVHTAGMERYLRTGHGLIVDADGPVEMPARKRNGEEIRVELRLSELVSRGGDRYAVAVIRDAMLRKQLELTNLELVQARVTRSEAETELTERDEMLGAVASTLDGHPTEEDLQRLATTLAAFRRLHSGQVAVRCIDADLVDILNGAGDAARRHAGGRRLLIHTPTNAPVSCDPMQVRKVLDEVFDEAIRRTRDGARVEAHLVVVSPRLVQLTIRSDAGGDTRPPGAGLQLSRTLIQRQSGTLTTSISSGGSLEAVMTLPGSPHAIRRRPSRVRRPGRPAPNSS